MRVVIEGRDLPGRVFWSDGARLDNVHVAVQIGPDPVGATAGDAASASWTVDVRVVHDSGAVDFRGPAVHGKRGDRFLYLTWGDVLSDGSFHMFRRAKLMLGQVDPELVEAAVDTDQPLRATVSLTDDKGWPRCARVDPPAIAWSV